MNERPKIGVGICIIKNNMILLGKRLNAHGAGTWAFPGGHLEYGETLIQCAEREVLEETGLHITNIRRGPYVEDIFYEENKHYITIIMIANCLVGEPVILEPHKCVQWEWFMWDRLPQPLFLTFSNLVKADINLQDYCNFTKNVF